MHSYVETDVENSFGIARDNFIQHILIVCEMLMIHCGIRLGYLFDSRTDKAMLKYVMETLCFTDEFVAYTGMCHVWDDATFKYIPQECTLVHKLGSDLDYNAIGFGDAMTEETEYNLGFVLGMTPMVEELEVVVLAVTAFGGLRIMNFYSSREDCGGWIASNEEKIKDMLHATDPDIIRAFIVIVTDIETNAEVQNLVISNTQP